MTSNNDKPKRQPATLTIRVDEQVYAHIEKHGQSLKDTPNTVLRRIFNLDKKRANVKG